MKNIAIIITRMIPGGASKVVHQILNGASEQHKYNFTLFTGQEEIANNLIDELSHCCKSIIIPSLIRSISPLDDFKAYRHLVCELRKYNFDTVHTHTSKAGFIGRMAAAKAGIPKIIHSPHGTIYTDGSNIQGVPDFSIGRKVLQMAEQWAGKRTTYLTTLSKNEKQICINMGLATQENCVVIPNGIDSAKFAVTQEDKIRAKQKFNIESEDRILLSVGRLSPEKGHKLLLDSFHNLIHNNRSHKKLKLFIVGTGPEEDNLKRQAESLKIPWSNNTKSTHDNEQIIFTGHICDIRNYLAAADIFIAPSLYEGFGIAIIEAMAAGLPVVASATGGIPEIITDNRDGILFNTGNSKELSLKLAEILNQPERMKQIAEAGKLRSEYFSEEAMVNKYMELYDS